MSDPYHHIREAAYCANMRLPELELVKFTFGNASVMDRSAGVFAIKPSGVAYEKLAPADMVVVNLEGKRVDGDLRPSSDTKTHAVLYQHWPEIGGIVHTHSTYATAWAQTQQPIPILGTTHADYLPMDVPCAPVMEDKMIERGYEYETGFQILNHFADQQLSPAEVEMILIAQHGPFTWGKDVATAIYNSAMLEELAKMAWLTRQIRPDAPRLKESLIQKHYKRKHGKDAYYGQ